MIASPINPSDLLTVRGRYGVLPDLPFDPGLRGGGRRRQGRARGWSASSWSAGGSPSSTRRAGTGPSTSSSPRSGSSRSPSDLPDEQVASFFVNPATVLAMVRHVLKVPKGAWLLQSAAGSTLGRMIIKLGKHDGFRTLNVVRRREAIDELKALGADAVISLGRRADRRAGPARSSAARASCTRSTRSAATPGPASSTRWRPTAGCSSTGRSTRRRSGSTPGG